ncbi:MAG: DNA starvation/stationary phase protection protein [Acetobacteraceae bacterium]|nr:DNA starvation/stationary phase protection protein [Acetobacteraceae bacterium]
MPNKDKKNATSAEREAPAGRNAPGVTEGMRAFVSDTYMLLAKTQSCHWNMRGPDFIGLHKLTEEQYNELFVAVDELAERIRALDELAPNSVREMMELSRLEELSAAPSTAEVIDILAADNQAMAGRAKELAEEADEAGDPATHDMLAARVEAHQKAAWLLRAHHPHGNGRSTTAMAGR